MHIHTTQASAAGNALSGAQAAETALALRRARELRDAGAKLKAAAMDVAAGFPSDPETDAQTVSMIAAWAGGSHGNADSPAQPTADSSQEQDVPPRIQEIQRTPPSSPVSYWA